MAHTSFERLHLAITMGDPAGIGPEVILKALASPLPLAPEILPPTLTIVGNRRQLEHCYSHLRSQQPDLPLVDPAELVVLEVNDDLPAQGLELGQESAAAGAASFYYLETAIYRAMAGQFAGIVTAPIAKSAWKAAGHSYPGQTELLAERSGTEQFGMLFVARSPYTGWTLRTLLATTHIPLRQVPEALTPDLLSRKLELLLACLEQDFGLTTPRIAIAGLNPHSGEQGQLGREEQDWLIPWLQQSRDHWPLVQLEGPVPPDTLWVKPGQAWFGHGKTGNSAADAYLALYHDQGLIPVKLMAFDQAVNTSIGLPFVRTSPDHGTAFDIAGRGLADAASMKAAISLAAELTYQRQHQRKHGKFAVKK